MSRMVGVRSYPARKTLAEEHWLESTHLLLLNTWWEYFLLELEPRPWSRTWQSSRSRGKCSGRSLSSLSWWSRSPCAWSWSAPAGSRSCQRSRLWGGTSTCCTRTQCAGTPRSPLPSWLGCSSQGRWPKCVQLSRAPWSCRSAGEQWSPSGSTSVGRWPQCTSHMASPPSIIVREGDEGGCQHYLSELEVIAGVLS